jgi:hypothetical protein
MPIISKKQEIKMSFTSIILDGDNESEIDFDLYDKNGKLYIKAFKNKKTIFDWPFESFQEIADFIFGKMSLISPSKNRLNKNIDFPQKDNLFDSSQPSNSIVIQNSVPDNSSASFAGGVSDFENHLNNKKPSFYGNSSSLISNPAFRAAMNSDEKNNTVEKERISRIVNGMDAIEIDLNDDIQDKAVIEEQNGIQM